MSEPKITFCEICKISLLTENDKKTHYDGKKHKRNEGLFISLKNSAERTVHVAALPNGILEMQLENYFNQFGPVSKIILDKQNAFFAFVEFSTKEAQQSCLTLKNHKLNGKLVKVSERRQRVWDPSNSPTNNFQEKFKQFENNCLKVFQQLQELKSVKDQFLQISWIVTLSREEMMNRSNFAKMIEKSLLIFFPGCQVFVYGSSASGYGFKGCDMDLTIQLPEKKARVDKGPLSNAPSVLDVQQGKVSKDELLNLPSDLMLLFLKKVISKIPKCARLMVIPSVRCPILRFLNTHLGISCDMCFNKKIAIQNTKLLKHYGRLDVRVRPLLLTLRYWAKLKDLLGSGHKFTSYSFTWLVLFYLQKCEPPVVPPVEALQKLAEEECTIEGYNIAFCEDYALLPKSQNKDDIVILLKGFYQFYFSFDFTMNAICPKTGKITDRNELKEEFVLHKDFKLTPLTLQDPFELDRNITSNVTATSVVNFLEMIEDAHKICQLPEFDNFSDDLKNPRGLNLFFSSNDSNPNRLKRKLDNLNHDMIFSIPFTDKMMDVFRQEFLEDYSSDQVTHKLMQKACTTIKNIFQEGLMMECTIIENYFEKVPQGSATHEENHCKNTEVPDGEYSPCKKNKVSDKEEKDSTQCELIMKLCCTAHYRTWNGRRKKRIDESSINSPLQCEKMLSLALIKEQQLEKSGKPLFVFEVHLFHQKKGAVQLMRINLVPVTESKEFTKCVSVFLVGYIPKIVESCLTYCPVV